MLLILYWLQIDQFLTLQSKDLRPLILRATKDATTSFSMILDAYIHKFIANTNIYSSKFKLHALRELLQRRKLVVL